MYKPTSEINPLNAQAAQQRLLTKHFIDLGMTETKARTRAKDIMLMLNSKYHSSELFRNSIKRLRNDKIFWFDQVRKPNKHRNLSAIYKPNKHLWNLLQKFSAIAYDELFELKEPTSFIIDKTYVQGLDKDQHYEKTLLDQAIYGKAGTIFTLNNIIFKEDFRKYSTFSLISNKARKCTNYADSVDVNSALPALSLWFLNKMNIKVDVPLTKLYIEHKDSIRTELGKLYQREFREDQVYVEESKRQELSIEKAKDIIKERINSCFFGASLHHKLSDVKHYDFIQGIQKEAQQIRKLVIDNLHCIDDDIFQVRLEYAIENRKTIQTPKGTQKKDKRGIMFFVFLEYYERQIREILDPEHQAMQVHDAVYFNTYPSDIDKRIAQAMKSYNITISKD